MSHASVYSKERPICFDNTEDILFVRRDIQQKAPIMNNQIDREHTSSAASSSDDGTSSEMSTSPARTPINGVATETQIQDFASLYAQMQQMQQTIRQMSGVAQIQTSKD